MSDGAASVVVVVVALLAAASRLKPRVPDQGEVKKSDSGFVRIGHAFLQVRAASVGATDRAAAQAEQAGELACSEEGPGVAVPRPPAFR